MLSHVVALLSRLCSAIFIIIFDLCNVDALLFTKHGHLSDILTCNDKHNSFFGRHTSTR